MAKVRIACVQMDCKLGQPELNRRRVIDWIAAANLRGQERGWSFIGQSKIVDFNGDAIAEATMDGQEILFADVDPREADNNRIVNVAGAHEDRRQELYGIIAGPI
jgi:predicted amidohydrolase